MHKLIATTFKILALSMLFMFLLDTSLLMVEIISIHSKVSNIASIMQTEVARNNCMPDNMADGFQEYLDSIVAQSRIVSDPKNAVITNFKQAVTVGNEKYDALTPENAKEYGEFTTLAVGVKLTPSVVYYNDNRTDANQSWLTRGDTFTYNMIYVYSVPCLRYLK